MTATRPPRRLTSVPLVGILTPVAALVLGVVLVRGFAGASFLAALATVAAPLLAAATPWVLRLRRWWLGPPGAAALYVLAWFLPAGLVRDAAAVLLVAGACLTLAALVAGLAPRTAIAFGLVCLVVLDVVLVWGTHQIGPTSDTLHAARPPSVAVLGARARELPALQDATFGAALMGWLDLAAPALLGFVAFSGRRFAAAAATTLAALGWGLLLVVTPTVPATVPVLAGLALAGLGSGRIGAPDPVQGYRMRPSRPKRGSRPSPGRSTK